ncbi:hypothetical protein PILCRDRAFT_376646 [Piloderma croceum F 1598]|uniref:Uncharacterized protein n=1 Tax=Piloderma croceum (strain F 1598) TaxID=765440 RepID=A0A0C3FZ25_PILCF|nr:hypothetical protein PILCRDRAFT_376646 [Piloderma croceum F 1598]
MNSLAQGKLWTVRRARAQMLDNESGDRSSTADIIYSCSLDGLTYILPRKIPHSSLRRTSYWAYWALSSYHVNVLFLKSKMNPLNSSGLDVRIKRMYLLHSYAALKPIRHLPCAGVAVCRAEKSVLKSVPHYLDQPFPTSIVALSGGMNS